MGIDPCSMWKFKHHVGKNMLKLSEMWVKYNIDQTNYYVKKLPELDLAWWVFKSWNYTLSHITVSGIIVYMHTQIGKHIKKNCHRPDNSFHHQTDFIYAWCENTFFTSKHQLLPRKLNHLGWRWMQYDNSTSNQQRTSMKGFIQLSVLLMW